MERIHMENMSKKIIENAIDYLQDPDHWIQGQMSDSKGRLCLVGALETSYKSLIIEQNPNISFSEYSETLFGSDSYFNVWLDVINKVSDVPEIAELRTSSGRGYPIAHYNDLPSTSHEDVLLVLKKALYDS